MKRSIAIFSPARLSIDLRRLKIENAEGESTIPLDEIAIVVLDHEAIQVTGPLLGEMGEQGIAVVVCNGKHLPSSFLLPYPGNTLMAQTMRGQMDAKRPTEKRLWQIIIREKVRAQGRLLIEKIGEDMSLGMMAYEVLSGDPTNVEGRAAARYFEALFGKEFKRLRQKELLDPDASDPQVITNAMLNYGYAVLRACVARAIVGAGLHPALGVQHHHRNNAFSLADDMMEPLRPLVDRLAYDRLLEDNLPSDLTPDVKRHLLGLLRAEVRWDGRLFPLDAALELYAAGVRRCLLGESKELAVPTV